MGLRLGKERKGWQEGEVEGVVLELELRLGGFPWLEVAVVAGEGGLEVVDVSALAYGGREPGV